MNIPISIKISPFYTNPLQVIKAMDGLGVKGFVLFNRLFQPEIDIHQEKLVFPFHLSHPEDHRLPLRFAGLLYGDIQADICSSTGIFTDEHAIALILAGASCFQMVSGLIQHKSIQITWILKKMDEWMDQHHYNQLNDFRGEMSKRHMKDPWAYTRAQYIRWIMNPDALMDNNPVP